MPSRSLDELEGVLGQHSGSSALPAANLVEGEEIGREVERPSLGDDVEALRRGEESSRARIKLCRVARGVGYVEGVVDVLERVAPVREARVRIVEVPDEGGLSGGVGARDDDAHAG